MKPITLRQLIRGFILLCLSGLTAQAMDSTELLPATINSPAFKYGMVSGVDSKYSSDGSVQTLNDINTVRFNSEQLSRLDPRLAKLIDGLNSFSKSQLGAQVDLGTLRIETEPSVKYFVPVFARGLTNEITIAAAMPVVFYKNKLSLVQSSSNVKSICSHFAGQPEVKSICDQMDVAVTDAARDYIKSQGYKPLQDRSETVLGDAQLVGLYKFHDNGRTSALYRMSIGLPTGPKNDPDDLADIGAFGQTSLEPQLLGNWVPTRSLRFAAKGAYKLVVPDRMEVRVPSSPDDVLPGPLSKEKVSRDIGDTITLGGAVNWALFDSFSVAGGYEFAKKSADRYRGSRNQRYDLLSKDSKSLAHRLRGGLTYDTIQLYQRTKSFPPLKLDFEVTNTVAGINVDRQFVNELTLTMFF